MDYNIDLYKINGNKIYLSGWYHADKYKIKVVSNNEEKEIKKYKPRFDICMNFHENIKDNNYGFEEEITFKENIKIARIYVIRNNNEDLILNIDNRKLIKFLRKVRKILGKIKRGVKFLWREYHFLVPPTMAAKYLKMFLKKDNKEILYNPAIESEYREWLSNQIYSKEQTNCQNEIVVINKNDKISNIEEKYTLLCNNNVNLVDGFYSEVSKYIEEDYDLIYFDNDEEENNKYKNPVFKPDWSRDTLLGVNYIGNCYLIKTELLKQYDKLNLYKILLDQIGKDIKIKHIPKILYHDLGKIENGKKEVEDYLKENKIRGTVKINNDGITNSVYYSVDKKPLVSIMIPTKDHADILDQCLKSIYDKTTYKSYEIIVIDNNSDEQDTFDLLKAYSKKYKNFSYKRIECEFNYSYLNNQSAKLSKGEYLILLNNDIEVISPNWLEIMLGYAQQKHIGTVGAKLLFPDNTNQHAGIIMGKGGLAGHAHYAKSRDYISPQYELKIPYNYSASTAACLMVSKEKFNEVGGLEEQLKVAFNDVDFNLKLLEKGYCNIWLPNVLLYHYESKSRGLDTSVEKQKRFVKEWQYVDKRWHDMIEHDPYYNDNFSKIEDYMLK